MPEAAASSGPQSERKRSVEFRENAGNLGQFFFGELNEPVVQIDRFERLDVNGLARGARGVHHTWNSAAIGRTHGDDEAFIAQRDVVLAGLFAARTQKECREFSEILSRDWAIPARIRFSCGEASSLISPLG